jgi:tetrahydromethanopterin S-methyltransferase subunit G
MVKSKLISNHIKSVRNIVVKGFAKVDQRLDGLDKKIDDTKIELKQDIAGLKIELKADIESLGNDIEDLAGMSAREFKAVRSEIAHRNLLQDA